MEIKADEITKIIREQIEEYRGGVDVSEVGNVISVGDGIARVYGLEKAMADTLGMFMQPFLDAGIKPEVARIRTALFVSALQGVTTQILHGRMRVTRTKAKGFIAETCRRLFEGFR